MTDLALLPQSFYNRETELVARELLGAVLVRRLADGTRLSGRIVETEAYSKHEDQASHARNGVTPRNKPMWGEPGHAYVYFTYGNHWMLNVVADVVGVPGAVLFRGLEPLEGIEVIERRRAGRKPRDWTNGPARLTAALDITNQQNTVNMTATTAGLWIEAGTPINPADIATGPRVGLGESVPEPWFSLERRYWIRDNKYVSKARK